MKEYLKKAECLRRRIQRKTNEIYLLHQQYAEDGVPRPQQNGGYSF